MHLFLFIVLFNVVVSGYSASTYGWTYLNYVNLTERPISIEARSYKKSIRERLNTQNLFDNHPSGYVPQSRTSDVYTGIIGLSMGVPHYSQEEYAEWSSRLKIFSQESLDFYSQVTWAEVLSLFEENAGDKLKFLSGCNQTDTSGQQPNWRLFNTSAKPLENRAEYNNLVRDFQAFFNVSATRTNQCWGVLSQGFVSQGQHGKSGHGGAAIIGVPGIEQNNLFAHMLGHTLGLGESNMAKLDSKGRYIAYSALEGPFSVMKATKHAALNGEVFSAYQQFFLGWNRKIDYQFIDFDQDLKLRNIGRRDAGNSTAPIALVWQNPYGGHSFFQFGRHGLENDDSARVVSSFADGYGVVQEITSPVERLASPIMDAYFYGDQQETQIGTTGLVMTASAAHRSGHTEVGVRFRFASEAFNMPVPFVHFWLKTVSPVFYDNSTDDAELAGELQTPGYTDVWFHFVHEEDAKQAWQTTPYIIPIQFAKLSCEDGVVYRHREVVYMKEERKHLFENLSGGIRMWPRRCVQGLCTRRQNKLNRRIKIRINYALSKPLQCVFTVDQNEHLYKKVLLQP